MHFYDVLAEQRGDSPELRASVTRVAELLNRVDFTSPSRPGILLGKIQSGKTRAFLGIIASSFDRGFDMAIVLTKGTKSLAKQTVARLNRDFGQFIEDDQIKVFDIMNLPAKLAGYELRQKLIIVVKKEDDNLRRLLDAFRTLYPDWQSKRVLLVDDEADYASITFRTKNGSTSPGVVASMIDELQRLVTKSDFLQVTATPYALYLQPDDEIISSSGEQIFLPKRPAFTELLPVHPAYVGGEYYFELADDPNSPAAYFYHPVLDREREALKRSDGRRLKLNEVLRHPAAEVIRGAFMTFLVGGAIRRLQLKAENLRTEKYSFLFHTETSTQSHQWQESVLTSICEQLSAEAQQDSPLFNELLTRALDDLRQSLKLDGRKIPSSPTIKTEVRKALLEGSVVISCVNSDNEVEQLLDEEGQLKLRAPFNVFIGGQILDRGITIANLIGFYYGRNPKQLQQDTVLQHCRMYGARPKPDLAVTRFYAPKAIYDSMRKIHLFDSGLRQAFESGAHDKGVYFIQRDSARRIIPCSPNKLGFSDVNAIRPGSRLLSVGFETLARTVGERKLRSLDDLLDQLCPTDGKPKTVSSAEAMNILDLCYDLLDPGTYPKSERTDFAAAIQHLARVCRNPSERDRVHILVWRDRNLARVRDSGRLSDAPDTKQQQNHAQSIATDAPVLQLFRQNGAVDQGWKGLPFWWPVIVTPHNSAPVVFADAERANKPAAATDTRRGPRKRSSGKKKTTNLKGA